MFVSIMNIVCKDQDEYIIIRDAIQLMLKVCLENELIHSFTAFDILP